MMTHKYTFLDTFTDDDDFDISFSTYVCVCVCVCVGDKNSLNIEMKFSKKKKKNNNVKNVDAKKKKFPDFKFESENFILKSFVKENNKLKCLSSFIPKRFDSIGSRYSIIFLFRNVIFNFISKF